MPEATKGSGFQIVAREDFSEVTYLLEIHHPLMARSARPGQFVIVMSHEHGERIPLTIADFDRGKGTITLVIQAVGKSTREMQQTCQVGTSLYGVAGPMGIPSEVSKARKMAFVGGGLGVAPIFPQARAAQTMAGVPGAMRQWGHHATAFVGRQHFDDADLLEKRFVLQLQ